MTRSTAPALGAAAVLMTAASIASGHSAYAGPTVDADATPFAVSESPLFFRPRQVLERLAASQHARAAELCVIGYRGPEGAQHAWVLWPERRTLILWEPTTGHFDNLALSRRWLHLDRDVVSNDSDIAGSTYLVTKAWADRVAADCRNHGDRYSIHVTALRAAPVRRAR